MPVDLEDPFFLYCWCSAEVIGEADKRVHESKLEVGGQLMYHERSLPAIAVRFKSNVRLRSIDDAIVVAWQALGAEQPARYHDGTFVYVTLATGDDECEWELGTAGRSVF